MATFLMFGKYSTEAAGSISAARTQKAQKIVRDLGGKIKDMYAMLGQHDLLLIVELPGVAEVTKASIALTKETGISFSTAPAISVTEFDKMVGGT